MAKPDLGDNGRPGPGDDLILFLERAEEALPTRYNGIFVALDETQLEPAETVWERLGFLSGERSECVRNITLGFTAR